MGVTHSQPQPLHYKNSVISKMCLQMSAMSVICKTTSEKKEKLTKAIINIIRKLKTSTGSKREKYMNMVRTEFNLEKNEKWVLTKLRMMLVRLDAGIEFLQIRTSETPRAKKRQSIAKDISCCLILTQKTSSKKIQREDMSSKQIKVTRKSKKSLEYRQMEKLRKTNFEQEKTLNNSESKVAFLRTFNLHPQVICL